MHCFSVALALHDHPLQSQNARVGGPLPAGDETSRLPDNGKVLDADATDALINGAYRQLFFHTLQVDRQPVLESQLRLGQISVRQFLRGLVLSPRFLDGVYACNGNKQVARHLVERLLGRRIHGEAEAIAWSIVIAEQGVAAMVDQLLDSDEYRRNFGDDRVPHQRRRVLAGRSVGDRPVNITLPRYEHHHRRVIQSFPRGDGGYRAGGGSGGINWGPRPALIDWPQGMPPAGVRRLWGILIVAGSVELTRVLLSTVTAMLSTAR
jgi:phycobilisome rod-core linker protein